MTGLAAIEVEEDRPAKAIEIAAAAKKYAEQEGIANIYNDNVQGKSYIDKAKEVLSESDIKKAEKSGAKLSLEDVMSAVSSEVLQII